MLSNSNELFSLSNSLSVLSDLVILGWPVLSDAAADDGLALVRLAQDTAEYG